MARHTPSGFFATPAQAGLRSLQSFLINQKDTQACYSGLLKSLLNYIYYE